MTTCSSSVIQGWYTKIDNMDTYELGRLYRFSEPGHIVFVDPGLFAHFNARFKALGGMTSELSKQIGWEK